MTLDISIWLIVQMVLSSLTIFDKFAIIDLSPAKAIKLIS